jgi:hypothetical protein
MRALWRSPLQGLRVSFDAGGQAVRAQKIAPVQRGAHSWNEGVDGYHECVPSARVGGGGAVRAEALRASRLYRG